MILSTGAQTFLLYRLALNETVFFFLLPCNCICGTVSKPHIELRIRPYSSLTDAGLYNPATNLSFNIAGLKLKRADLETKVLLIT